MKKTIKHVQQTSYLMENFQFEEVFTWRSGNQSCPHNITSIWHLSEVLWDKKNKSMGKDELITYCFYDDMIIYVEIIKDFYKEIIKVNSFCKFGGY